MAEGNEVPVAAVLDTSAPGGGSVIALCGELDASSVDSVREVVDGVLEWEQDRIVFEMDELTFLDSLGMAVLVHAANRVRAVELRHPTDAVRRVIKLTGLADVFIVD